MKLLFGLALFAAAVLPAAARVEFDASVQDDAVVQRGAAWRVGGSTDSTAAVVLRVDGRRVETMPRDGRWSVELAVPADARRMELALEGGETRRVLAGDVWLCSGQSNMAMPTSRAQDGAAIAEGLADVPLRLLKVLPPTRARGAVQQPWQRADAAGTRAFSAVCLAFGRELQRRIGVPVGLVDASLGGTRIEAWISAASLPPAVARDETYLRRLAPEDRGGGFEKNRASILFDGMIAGLAQQPLRGVLWYQGESNRINAASYADLLGLLMQDWRRHWRQGDLPFVIVQLPGFGASAAAFDPASPMAAVREAQAVAAARDRNAVAVNTLDLGDVDLHPPRKLPFGQRAAAAAERRFYGQGASAPAQAAIPRPQIQGARISVDLKPLAACVSTQGPIGPAVQIAGSDGQWQPAEAELSGSTLMARSTRVPRPVALRYAWADHPATPLQDCANNVPLPGFRTDDWSARPAGR
jgi:sialate O-acetylesterase